MNINDLTIGEAKELVKLFSNASDEKEIQSPLSVGEKVYIRRAAQYHYLGEVVCFDSDEIVLKNASWVADGRYLSEFLKNGLETENIEIEPFSVALVSVPRPNCEVAQWNHALPTKAIP